ncbi:MAG: acylphosphatase [Candidatus Limnocylindrales bacterium]
MSANERLEASVSGRVQSVGFRWFVRSNAARLGLKGWTANQSDGSVKIIAEGESSALDDLQGALKVGPTGASVDRVKASRGPATGDFKGFEIRSGAHRGD